MASLTEDGPRSTNTAEAYCGFDDEEFEDIIRELVTIQGVQVTAREHLRTEVKKGTAELLHVQHEIKLMEDDYEEDQIEIANRKATLEQLKRKGKVSKTRWETNKVAFQKYSVEIVQNFDNVLAELKRRNGIEGQYDEAWREKAGKMDAGFTALSHSIAELESVVAKHLEELAAQKELEKRLKAKINRAEETIAFATALIEEVFDVQDQLEQILTAQS